MEKKLAEGIFVVIACLLITSMLIGGVVYFTRNPENSHDTKVVSSIWQKQYVGINLNKDLTLEQVQCTISINKSVNSYVLTDCPVLDFTELGVKHYSDWHSELSLDFLLDTLNQSPIEQDAQYRNEQCCNTENDYHISDQYLTELNEETKQILLNDVISLKTSKNIIFPQKIEFLFIQIKGKQELEVWANRRKISPSQVSQLTALIIFKIINTLYLYHHPNVDKDNQDSMKVIMQKNNISWGTEINSSAN